ncbi:DNA repair protein RecN [Phocaeicola coprophilus]|nr:DNA repair protein RecN [Phocaeicola coprophilus]
MLQSLFIQNYALIDTLDIRFHSGFSVITGETGAGKSIILGAIGLLLGQRADTKAIKKGASRCIIEAHFQIGNYNMEDFFERNDLTYEPECILRREIMASGKSRAFINDTPSSLSQMKELGEMLIDIHSQHQNLLLNSEGFQLNVVDIIAQDTTLLSHYKQCFAKYKNSSKALAEAIETAKRNKADEDYIRFQLEQFTEAGLKEGEQEELEQEVELLNHAEEIKSGLYQIDAIMAGDEGGILSGLKEVQNRLHDLKSIYPSTEELAERLDSCYIELKDIEHEISNQSEEVEFNPQRLEYVNERLNQLYSLQQKHHVNTVSELMTIEQSYQDRLNAITSSEDQIAELTAQKDKDLEKVLEIARELTAVRTEAARKIEQQMKSYLIPLGIPNVQFVVELTPRKEPDNNGADCVNFLFSANKNGTLQNVASVASGGEIARVMLSIKALIAGAVKLPTIIFDEIDTGVSGQIAERMAHIMQEMGNRKRQVISITHLPQIAALGSYHYKVYKQDDEQGTTSHIRQLTPEERVEEIAHMLSGATLTDAAINNAKALLQHP